MAAQTKAHMLNEIHTLLKKRYKPKPDKGATRFPVLDAVVYGACHEGTTREQASQALNRFKDEFFDWNEVRVSTVTEIQSALAGLPDPEPRAQRIRRFLRQLFEKTYAFNLDALAKKPLKESLKALEIYEAFSSDYIEATVVQQALGGHAIPVDTHAQRALTRLGISETGSDHATVRGLLERAIPKNRGAEFVDLIEDLAHDTCVDPVPECPRCELRKICPTAAARKEEAISAAKLAASRAKAVAKDASASKEKPKDKDKEREKSKEIVKEVAKPPAKAAPGPPPAPATAPKSAKPRPGGPKAT